jgi:hypothetical protein
MENKPMEQLLGQRPCQDPAQEREGPYSARRLGWAPQKVDAGRNVKEDRNAPVNMSEAFQQLALK